MPQFDIFSFFSQLFWVFVGFILLYLSICYFLLPALSSILKVRKRKLNAETTQSADSHSLFAVTNSLLNTTKQTITLFSTLLTDILVSSRKVSSIKDIKKFNSIFLKYEITRTFNSRVLANAQKSALLSK